MTRPGTGIAVGAVGLKGAVFVSRLAGLGLRVDEVVSYRQADDASHGFERIREAALGAGWRFTEARRPASEDGLFLLVGWQHLTAPRAGTTVVFHDSLLPELRGFAPTVTALIRGDRHIGVTAFLPSQEAADDGPIVGQRSMPVSYPLKIGAALEAQAELMAGLAAELIGRWQDGGLAARAQDHAAATYSLWRDADDYEIDWHRPAPEIARFVDAVGHPYAGARTAALASRETIRVLDAEALPDLPFAIRDAGKVWRLDAGRPVVVCGEGLLRLNETAGPDGGPYRFERLRTRLGRPAGAAP